MKYWPWQLIAVSESILKDLRLRAGREVGGLLVLGTRDVLILKIDKRLLRGRGANLSFVPRTVLGGRKRGS